MPPRTRSFPTGAAGQVRCVVAVSEMEAMRAAWFVGFFVLALSCGFGCSSGSDSSGSAGNGGFGGGLGSWDGGATQKGWWCRCNSGLSIGLSATLSQSEAEAACPQNCQDQGGMLDVIPLLTVEGSPECEAFCAKADALGCGGASCAEDADFWCEVRPSSCEDATRAKLQCKADKGVFECSDNGWQETTMGCSDFKELCP